MKRLFYSLSGLGLVSLLIMGTSVSGSGADKAGKTRTIKSMASGSFDSANFDFDNPDLSTPAFDVHGEGKGDSGKFTYQAVVEVAPDGKTCSLPGGAASAGTEFTLVGRYAVSRDTSSGDLLFTKATSITLCADLSTSPTPPFPFITTDERGVITGGTGMLAGATGTFSAKEKGAFLVFDTTGKHAFGWFQSHIVTTLNVP